MKAIFTTLNPAGGLNYHLRSVLNRKRWRPFCETVEGWLIDWHRECQLSTYSTLVLIGASAGYTLPISFLSQFRVIVLNEPDPVAQMLFRARFSKSGAKIIWDRTDYLGTCHINTQKTNKHEQKTEVQKPKLYLLNDQYPNSAILFCNVLGQVPVLLHPLDAATVENHMKILGEQILNLTSKHAVATYHDRFSKNILQPHEVIDHLTKDMFGRNTQAIRIRKEFPWRLSMLIEHQIEFVAF
jgi:hypothetical protein